MAKKSIVLVKILLFKSAKKRTIFATMQKSINFNMAIIISEIGSAGKGLPIDIHQSFSFQFRKNS